ncbi:MAG: hypothetical protein WBC93_02665 [Sulfitobacter sp.]
MDGDLAIILGLVLAGLSLPSILSAVSDRRAPRASAVTILIAGGLILYAMQSKPGGYGLTELPEVFFRVVGQLTR